MSSLYSILPEDPFSADAVDLMDELSDCLYEITGSSGRSSFDPNDVCTPRSVFVILRDEKGEAGGCGAIRPMDEKTAEVKRMYCKTKGRGLGSLILEYLENYAEKTGYLYLKLETRKINHSAVMFYLSRGYHIIQNYSRYAGREEAVCFEKALHVNLSEDCETTDL